MGFRARHEAWGAIAIVAAFVLLAGTPHALAWLAETSRSVHLGFVPFYPGDADALSYLAWVERARGGDLVWPNPFNPEPHEPVVFNLLWVLVGLVSRVAGVSSYLALDAARWAGSLAAGLAAWALIRQMTDSAATRLGALALTLLSGGLGWVSWWAGLGWQPSDVLIADVTPFLSVLFYPHFGWALAALWAGLALALVALEQGRRDALLAGCATFLVLGFFHPYDLLTAGAVLFVWGLVLRAWTRETRLRWLLLLGSIALPLAAQAWMVLRSPVLRSWKDANLLPAPRLDLLLAGFGLIALVALVSLVPALSSANPRGKLLWAWVLAGLLLVYAPLLGFSHHLTLGLRLPLATLAAAALAAWCGPRTRLAALLLALLVLAGLPTLLMWTSRTSTMAARGAWPTHLPRAVEAALRRSGEHVPEGEVVLAPPRLSPYVPALARRPVLWGHPHLTPDAGARRAALGWVYAETRGAAPGGEALALIDAAEARWIVRRAGQPTRLEVLRGVERRYALDGGYELLRVRLASPAGGH